MSADFQLVLDTTGPQGVVAEINGGALYTSGPEVLAVITTTDPNTTTGYQVKIWGADVDVTANPDIQDTEANSDWITLAASHAVTILTGDGLKTLNFRLRDDVWNESALATATITLDTAAPVITVVGPDVPKVSEQPGKRTANFSFTSDSDLVAFTVRVVPDSNATHDAGVEIPSTNGSTNVSGGAVGAGVTVNGSIDGRDLKLAGGVDGVKEIKVFGQDAAGAWSL